MLPSSTDPAAIPDDFPRTTPGSLAGVQPKLTARLIDGQYVEGMTYEELFARYEACEDLAKQLAAYARRKRVELQEMPLEELLRRLRAGIVKKRFDLDAPELDWVMRRVTEEMGGGPVGAPCLQVALDARFLDSSPYQHVDSVVDVALGRIRGQEPRTD